MPVLPSGRFVDIMSDRARLHASRRGFRVSEKTPHHQLYPLIDILTEEAHTTPGCRKRYGFSGYTLGDRPWISSWDAADRSFFLEWVQRPAQVRTIELARRRLLAEDNAPRDQIFTYPQRLYSVLEQRLRTLPMARAGARQWRHTLLNMKRNGLRGEELTWSGVLEWLAGQPDDAALDKTQVLAALDLDAVQPQLCAQMECDRACRLPFCERARRIPSHTLQMAGYPLRGDDVAVLRYQSERPGYRIGRVWFGGRALAANEGPAWFVLGPYGQPISPADGPFFSTAEMALHGAQEHAQRSFRAACTWSPSTRYEYMSLHGGEDYREWLVTLPHYPHSHFSGHFHERNILLHVRTKIRRSDTGERVLFVEELQSDWHQAVARYGHNAGIAPAPFRREWPALALKLMLIHAVEQGLDGIAWADGQVQQMRYDRSLIPLLRLYDQELPRLLNRLGRPWGAQVQRGRFATRSPWLHAARSKDAWKVEGGEGKFCTRPRYTKLEAQALIARHSKALTLELPMLLLPDAMRCYIEANGLPLFGESVYPLPPCGVHD